MTYSIMIGRYKVLFSDTHFKPFRKKPTISVYDAESNSETKIASFNSQETFEWFVKTIAEQTEPQTDGYIKGEDFLKIFTEPQTDCAWK